MRKMILSNRYCTIVIYTLAFSLAFNVLLSRKAFASLGSMYHFHNGQDCFYEGEYKEALDSFTKAYRLDGLEGKDRAMLDIYRFVCLANLNRTSEAITIFISAFKLRGNHFIECLQEEEAVLIAERIDKPDKLLKDITGHLKACRKDMQIDIIYESGNKNPKGIHISNKLHRSIINKEAIGHRLRCSDAMIFNMAQEQPPVPSVPEEEKLSDKLGVTLYTLIIGGLLLFGIGTAITSSTLMGIGAIILFLSAVMYVITMPAILFDLTDDWDEEYEKRQKSKPR